MNNYIKGTLVFSIGAAIGSAITYKVVERKFKDISDSEIESVKMSYKKKEETLKPKPIKESYSEEENKKYGSLSGVYASNNKNDKIDYASRSKIDEELVYTEKIKEHTHEEYKRRLPIVIGIDDFDDDEHNYYEKITFTYWSDNTLTDENDQVVNLQETVGEGFADGFEADEDSLYLRDDERHIDYEIVRDKRAYADVAGDMYDGEDE